MPIMLNRRSFTRYAAASFAILASGAGRSAWRGDDPFTLGIASGDPHPTSVVLWTRLVPRPFEPDGGMPRTRIPVRWEVSEHANFSNGRRGVAIADPAWGHSVHVEADGLRPGRPYFYRFIVDGVASPVGRTRTAPAPGSSVDRLRLAFASCQNYEGGYYGAHRHMVADEPDLVLFLGDYIYEGNPRQNMTRRHQNPEPVDLNGYRARYATYKLDQDLQAAHAAAPWVSTWDDHEVQDNYTGDYDKFYGDPVRFARRRAAAYQAYYEHMPLRIAARPRNGSMRLFRSIDWGNLAQIQVLDDRQYRSTAPCQPPELRGSGRQTVGLTPDCPERHDPRRTLLGNPQMRWLDERLKTTRAQWNFLGQQTLMMPIKRIPHNDPSLPPSVYNVDAWDGFTPSREHIVRRWRDAKVSNPVVLSGDIHSFVAGDHFDPDAPGRIVASEFVGGSISSGAADKTLQKAASLNPGFHFAENQVRGYGRIDLTPRECRVTLRSLADVSDRNTPARDLARFAIEAGRPGIQRG